MAYLCRVVTVREVPHYINIILIPETSILLIMEDMKVDEETARTILKESAAFGEIYGEIED
jgi:hypothetical protein